MDKAGLTKAVITLYGIDENGELGDSTETKPQVKGKEINAVTSDMLHAAGKKQTEKGSGKQAEIEVQYNPSSIRCSGDMADSNFLKQHSGESIISASPDGTIRTSFTLMLEAASGEDTSVQRKMELVMKFLQKSSKREVMFKWGALLSVKGELISFSGSFDRFNRTGLPLGGKMNLTIQTSLSDDNTSK